MSRFSSLITEELLRDSGIQEAEQRFEAQKDLDQLQNKASIIIGILISSKDFAQTFLCNTPDDLHVFSHPSKRIIVVDILTRCPIDQVVNFDSYKFTTNPQFEKKISQYTRSADKPNVPLSKSRSWDVALCVILKVEALDSLMASMPNSRLLFREYNILKHAWECFHRENMDIDEMTGIPMVFDYTEVPNPIYNSEETEECKVVDIYGSLIPWKSESGTNTTLSFMSMEKLGPNIQYLQELMVHTKRRTRTFDLDTGFKVFDQLICRCLQLHRFGIVHNAIDPKNIYFGRSCTFNVVYLGNYTRSMVVDGKDRKMADVFLGGDPRFTSQYRARRTYPNPMQDIESAFYTLLSMIVSNLPWDAHLMRSDSVSRQSDNQNLNNPDNLEGIDSFPRVREAKSSFWKSQNGINRVLADVRYLSVGTDESHINMATEILKDLYSRLRDQFQMSASHGKAKMFNLVSSQTSEYQFYLELRRATLLFFRFESLSVSLCTPTYQKKIEAVARDEQEPRTAWNISNWCFNVVLMYTAGNMRMSMMPISFVARTTD